MKIIPYSTRLLLLSHFFSYVYSQLFLVLQTITIRLWKTSKPEEQQHVVPAHQKEMLWEELKDMFTLPEKVDQELVKKYALKKMALAFATFKKKLYINYIKKDKEPNWDGLPHVKSYWEEFKQYKLLEEAQEKSEQAKVNAANKKYSHHLGAAGYKKSVKNGRRWSSTLWIEASCRRLGIGRIDPSGGYLLMA